MDMFWMGVIMLVFGNYDKMDTKMFKTWVRCSTLLCLSGLVEPIYLIVKLLLRSK